MFNLPDCTFNIMLPLTYKVILVGIIRHFLFRCNVYDANVDHDG